MKFFKKSSLVFSLLALCTVPALASVTVNSPANGATVTSQFPLSAVSSACSNQNVSAMGFSLDSSTNTTLVNGTSLKATVNASAGNHILHVKSWGGQGAACVVDVAIMVIDVAVSAPGNGATVVSPFSLVAGSTICSSQRVVSMGYSLDSGSTTIVKATAINASLAAAQGGHTLHVKSWGDQGASCDRDVDLEVVNSPAVNPGGGSSGTSTPPSSITVRAPASNTVVPSPFVLNASAFNCATQPVVSMGYSLDSSTSTAVVSGRSILASVSALNGNHTINVKAWGAGGAVCVDKIGITVTAPALPVPNIAVRTPAAGASVSSPFDLVASSSACSSQSVAAMGYSLDNSTATTIVNGTSMNTSVSASVGQHTLWVKAWGTAGAACATSQIITVTNPSSSPAIPSDAVSVSNLQAMSGWLGTNDSAGSGTSSGVMNLTATPSLSGNARQFVTSFLDSGDERYWVSFGDDTSATNFFYDGWVYFSGSASNIANLEMDMNQVMANGQTVLYGLQCDSWTGTWDYTANTGTATNPVDTWLHSSAACNPHNWSANTWHHVQASYSRDNAGNVTYQSVWLDSVESPINATVPSAFALGWAPVLLTNFQVDGLNSGSNTVYLDNLSISRW